VCWVDVGLRWIVVWQGVWAERSLSFIATKRGSIPRHPVCCFERRNAMKGSWDELSGKEKSRLVEEYVDKHAPKHIGRMFLFSTLWSWFSFGLSLIFLDLKQSIGIGIVVFAAVLFLSGLSASRKMAKGCVEDYEREDEGSPIVPVGEDRDIVTGPVPPEVSAAIDKAIQEREKLKS
jgi:hypothetical protein